MEYAYYAKLIKDGFHTQCTLDLESGAVKIQDVPFEFRNTEAYEAAHLYARTIKDEKERADTKTAGIRYCTMRGRAPVEEWWKA